MGVESDPRVRFQRPTLPPGDRIESYLAASRRAGWYANGGPCCRELSGRIEARVGAEFIPVASGTVGLIAATAAVLGSRRRRGGIALMPSFTFPATAQAAVWNGLEPRLLDVDPRHWHLDPEALEVALSRDGSEVALVVAVSSFGTPPPASVRDRWERACADAGVPLVVDSAAGFGAVAQDGRAVGAQGDVEVVSFHATKPFAVGEGGGVLTRDPELAERIRRAINFGMDDARRVTMPYALNGKMSEIHAAVALAVLDEIDAILSTRRATAAALRAGARPGIAWQEGCEASTWQFVPVAFEDNAARAASVAATRDTLETRVYYEPLHRSGPFAGAEAGPLPVTEDLAARILALPMANDISASEREAISRALESPAAAAVASGVSTADLKR